MKRLLSVVIMLLASSAHALDWQDSPAVATVLAGASSDEQMAANAKAGSWILGSEEVEQIRAILEGTA
jgi:aryl-alcohol dehydrogenase-like predicted oxidoreductase